jgi:type IV secretion system protein VirB10
MTTPQPVVAAEVPPAEAPAAAADPHASKIAPDDPRLRIRPARGRTLKRGPAIALVVGAVGTIVLALVVALLPSSKPVEAKKAEGAEPTSPTVSPVVPEAIRNAPEHLSARPPPATDRLLVVPLPDAGFPDEPWPPTEGRPVRGGGAYGAGPRQELELRARGASILFETGRGASSTASPSIATAAQPAAANPSFHRPAGTLPPDVDPNGQLRKNAFVDSEGAAGSADVLAARLQHPRSPYEVKAGTIIPAVLITGINSDLPGPVIGQVRENVYDTVSGNYLLIPQGARLLAQYDSMIAWGQERVLVCWNRLLFPNGDSIDLQCMPAADLAGAAGLADGVDEHWGRILKGAAVATLLAATTTTVAGNTQGFNPTVPQTLARNAATEMNAVGQRITAQNMSIQPTITVRPGFSVNVIVTKDLVLSAPYAGDAPAQARAAVHANPPSPP